MMRPRDAADERKWWAQYVIVPLLAPLLSVVVTEWVRAKLSQRKSGDDGGDT
jgi:hypothetical protein